MTSIISHISLISLTYFVLAAILELLLPVDMLRLPVKLLDAHAHPFDYCPLQKLSIALRGMRTALTEHPGNISLLVGLIR